MIAILPDMEKYRSPVSKRVIVPKNVGTQKRFPPHLHCLFFMRICALYYVHPWL